MIELVDDREIGVTLLQVADDEAATPLADAQAQLADAGIDVQTVLATAASPLEALLSAVPDHDAIVMGEQAPSLQSFLLGDVTDRVAAGSVGPVLVVSQTDRE